MSDPLLPGGIGISRLCVYDTTTPDGQAGGTPHIHLCCSEAYVVIAGTGAVQTLSASGFASFDLRAGTVLWFTPGTVHRLINHGDLEIVVIMANTGLPEAGDAVLTFPPDTLADPARYAAAATLPDGGAPGTDITTAYQRRDLAIEGFQLLREGGPQALKSFYEAATKLKQPQLVTWRTRWQAGAKAAAEATGAHLTALAQGDTTHLTQATVTTLPAPSEEGRLGMCGLLNTYVPGAITAAH